MGKALLLMVALVLMVYALWDVYATPRERVQVMPKWAWLLLIVLFIYVGPLLWLFFGTVRDRPSGGRPDGGPRRPRGPDDDPDFLRGLGGPPGKR